VETANRVAEKCTQNYIAETFGKLYLVNIGKCGGLQALLRVSDQMDYNSRLLGDRLCGLVVRVLGYRSGGPGSIPGTTRKKNCGSGTGSTQPRKYN
jgi:hypothetical protein